MERKLIKQGGGGYTIYLPKKWVERKGLKEGGVVNIEESEVSLVIRAQVQSKKVITITLDEDSKKVIYYILTQLYRKGFEEIKLENMDSETFNFVKKIVSNNLLGFELTEKGNNFCIIESISEPTDNKYENLIRKMFLVLEEMVNVISIDGQDKYNNKNEISDYRIQQDKLALFCRRVIMKEKENINPISDWEFLTFITHSTHLLQYLYDYSSERKIKLKKEYIDSLNELKRQIGMIFEAYKNKDIKIVNTIYKLRKEYLFEKSIKLIEKSKGGESVIASYLRELFREIQIGASPLMNKFIEKQ